MPNCKCTGNKEISLLAKKMTKKKKRKKGKDELPDVLWLQGIAVEHLSFNSF